MSVVTVGKNGRVYQRKFDWEQAARMHAEGMSYAEIGRAFGVTPSAVSRAVDPETHARMAGHTRAWMQSGVCEKCGKKGVTCAALRQKTHPNWDGRVLCVRCRGVESRTRLRFDSGGALISVCCTKIDCANGERWQPPENFPGGVDMRDVRPKGIHSVCRACNTQIRRDNRHANRERERLTEKARRDRNKRTAA